MNTTQRRAENAHPSRFRSFVIPIVVLLVGIPASIGLYVAVQHSVIRFAQLQFDREANAANSILDNHLQSYGHVLYALRAQFARDEPVTRIQFTRFVKSLDIPRRYPGFTSLNFAAYVPGSGKRNFERVVRSDTSVDSSGYPSFSIVPQGDRSEYFVLLYLEPYAGYEFAFGLDLGANPMAKDPEKVASALRMGRDSGELMASAQPLRVKRETEAIYLAMRLAVYSPDKPVNTVSQRREAYIGSVGAAFDVASLVTAALNTDTLRRMRCKLYDAGSVSEHGKSVPYTERRLLFDTASPPGGPVKQSTNDDSKPHVVYRDQIKIADRIWEFEYSAPRDVVISTLDKVLPPLVLSGGLLTTLLLFGIVYTLATSRRRAVAIAEDITRDLRDSERGLAEAQQIAHLGNWALDPATWTMTCSAETYRILGLQLQAASINYADFLQRVYEADRAAVDQAIRESLANSQDRDIEHRIYMHDGSLRWAHTVAKPSTRKRLGLVSGIVMDITERKHADEKLTTSHQQLQALSRQLVDVQEVERRRFSAELHDVVGQNLTALSINLDIVKTQLLDDRHKAVQARLTDSALLLQSTTEAIENVMSELRPPMLDDYGLLPALQWYARQFSDRMGIQVNVHGDDSMQRLTPSAEIALFRVAQEALNNVAKHAQAKNVEIRLERKASHCIMSVSDDGTGLGTDAKSSGPRRPGFGMVTMRERTQAIGGSLVVDGEKGRGTRIELQVPC